MLSAHKKYKKPAPVRQSGGPSFNQLKGRPPDCLSRDIAFIWYPFIYIEDFVLFRNLILVITRLIIENV